MSAMRLWLVGYRAVVLATSIGLLAACGSDDDSGHSIPDTNLSGTLGAQPWSFADGQTDPFLSQDDQFYATLQGPSQSRCDAATIGERALLIAFPKQPGERELGDSYSVTFKIGEENLIATEGVIRIDQVTDTTAIGALQAAYDVDNEVSGVFDVTVCPGPA